MIDQRKLPADLVMFQATTVCAPLAISSSVGVSELCLKRFFATSRSTKLYKLSRIWLSVGPLLLGLLVPSALHLLHLPVARILPQLSSRTLKRRSAYSMLAGEMA